VTEPAVALVRRWAVDWLGGQHPEVCDEVLAPEYALLIGGYLLGPRAAYVPATVAQLRRYPGLVVTTHDLVVSGDRVAVVFTESGASARLAGRTAAWSGVALFRSDGQRLTHCWAEEDYYARRRQLDAGACDPVERPAAAPWDTVSQPADPDAEQVVRAWLAGPDLRTGDVVCDDEATGRPPTSLLEVEACEVHELFSAGPRVAFAAVQSGRYAGGLEGLDAHVGRPARLGLAGLVEVRDGRVAGGRVVRDRLGTARVLEEPAAEPSRA
jgi:predicted ester cyclase